METEIKNKISTKNKIKLNNGIEIPSIGYGTNQIRKKMKWKIQLKLHMIMDIDYLIQQ